MVSPCLLRLSVLTTSISLASSLHVSKDDRRHNLGARAPPSILPSPSQDVAHTLHADFLTDSAKTDTMIGEDVHVSCDSMYGFALRKRSCLNVLTFCPSGTKVESWAYPSDVPPGQTVDEVLPIKLFSSECTLTALMELGKGSFLVQADARMVNPDDATCTIQALIPGGGGLIAHASPSNVTRAAHAIYNKCVVEKSGVGGKAYDIGGDNMLHVVMSGFNPHVECLGAMTAPLSSCGVLVQQMRKDYAPEKFGRPWDTTINYALPLVQTAPDGRCQIVVDTLGPTVQANWNGIWQAVSSTIALCGRAGKGGKASVANEAFPIMEGLFIQVHDRVTAPPLAAGSNGTVKDAAVETATSLSAVPAKQPWGFLLPSGASISPAIMPSSAPTVASS